MTLFYLRHDHWCPAMPCGHECIHEGGWVSHEQGSTDHPDLRASPRPAEGPDGGCPPKWAHIACNCLQNRGDGKSTPRRAPWVGDTGTQVQSLIYTKDTLVGLGHSIKPYNLRARHTELHTEICSARTGRYESSAVRRWRYAGCATVNKPSLQSCKSDLRLASCRRATGPFLSALVYSSLRQVVRNPAAHGQVLTAESARVSPVATEICSLSLATGLESSTDCACLGGYNLWPSVVCSSAAVHTAFAAVPEAPAISFVGSAETICSCVVTAWHVWLPVLALADCCNSVDQVVLPFGIAPPNRTCLAGDPLWHVGESHVDQDDLSADGPGAACAATH